MKIKSYHILFRLLSYLADKSNGAPILVKYKLLLGTLIVSVASSSANTFLSKIKPANDSIPLNDQTQITCYDHVGLNDLSRVTFDGHVLDESGEPILGVTVTIKGERNLGTVTDVNGRFALSAGKTDTLVFSYLGFNTQEVPALNFRKSISPVIMKETYNISCYEPVITRIPSKYKDDIYNRAVKRITKLPYDDIEIRPVSPVGELYRFKYWMDENVKYNESMLKDQVQGTVILSFAIDKQGKITNKKVIGKLSPEADAEALRVLSSSENWTPGEHGGEKIKTTLTVEVSFKMPK